MLIAFVAANADSSSSAALTSEEFVLRVDGAVARLRVQDRVGPGAIARLQLQRVRVVQRGRVGGRAESEPARRLHARRRRARRAVRRAHRREAALAHSHALPTLATSFGCGQERGALGAQVNPRVRGRPVRHAAH